MKRREYSTHIYPTSAAFQVFTPDEVRKLCVTKISTSVTFDNFGHPTDGGLYDKLMGPLSEDSDPCGTCLQNSFSCPGHFGYIDLVLPTVNPLFHKIVATIVKISCLSCFAIQLPGHLKHILALQMKLLKCDYISEALEIGNLFGELLETYGALEQIPEDVELPTASYEALVLKAKRNPDFVSTPTKTTEMLKNEMANKVLHSIKAKKNCYFCKQPLDKIQAVRNKIIITKKANSDGTLGRLILTPEEARNILREIWKVEKHFLKHFAPILAQTKCKYPTDVFFLDIVPVLPPAARPVNVLRGRKIESGQSFIYKNILDTNYLLSVIMRVVKSKGELGKFSPEVQKVYASAPGNSPLEKMNNVWDFLQANVNAMLDHTPKHKEPGEGVRQIIEKKEGIIRMHMMGKRVNFAARSVITPDPNLNIDEIGIPEVFAKHLTYPVNVTPWNVEMLRKMVLNGPNVHPGAAMVELEDGSVVKLNPDDYVQRESIMKRLLTPGDSSVRGFRGLKKVYRHLCNGDVLLLNRQPTLHRPSIMAHTARILKGEKTLRLHYANCKAYNADFDGDEMNAHFPQGELARSEAYNLAHVCHQYLVPKDGTPLSGLIQDHMIAGVKLSIRGKFFSRMDYQQLVYQGLSHVTTQFKLLPPSIIKPVQLWSGKQVISTIIINILPSSKPPINLKGSAKISAKAWEAEKPRRWKSGIPLKNDKDMSEAEVVIKNGELLVGVLDKMHYGATPYGLVHCVYELYGGRYATKLLSAFTKLFTYFLQRQGFTLGVHDILVTRRADRRRRKLIEEVRTVGRHAMASALDMDPDAAVDEMLEKMEELSLVDKKLRSVIDRHYKSVVDDYTNRINKACLPTGLLCSFPENNLQLMVQSGAKGSTVNTMQISCLLGQIELEGKRPPLMISGKSLPSFPSFEFSPRAGGFIDGRFMTGIQPQEFFFHCMAGREGLIDTAVKTSRSGYLQRCLVKHLEGITVGYDLTVRDSDKSVIQFLYGEDGMDVGKVQFLNKDQLPFLEENVEAVTDKDAVKTLKEDETVAFVDEHIEKLRAFKRKHATFRHQRTTPFTAFSSAIKDKIPEASPTKMSSKTGRTKLAKKTLSLWRKAQENVKGDLEDVAVRCPVPVNSLYRPDLCFGSVNERLRELVDDLSQGMRKKRRRKFEDMVKAKAMESLAAPGEPVGLLAAQSIGEPSTQMTLNTFHFAGRGEMNVTLGIPRLREILMGATKNIKTPSMEIPFRTDASDLKRRAEQLCVQLTRVCLSDVLERIDVTYRIEVQPIRQQSYTLRLHFLPEALYKGKFKVNGRSVIRHVERKFFAEMFGAIRKQLKIRANLVSVEKERGKRRAADGEEAEDAGEGGGGGGRGRDSSDEASDDGEDAKVGGKCKELREGQELVEEEDREMDAFSEEEGETGEDEVDATMRTQDGDGDSDNEESKEEFHADKFDVIYRYNFAKDYDYDRKEFLWCELKFAMPLSYRKIDMTSVLKERAAKSVIWETPNIKRAITYEKDGRFVLRTDGININEMSKYEDLLDLKNLYSNDIHKIAETYGIEAARRVIVKEVRDVFNVYGIRVDPRHLLLIADYMTFNGTFEPLNRKGMSSSVSPMQQMSFESSTTFLKEAVIGGKHDGLTGPSGCLMVGKQCPIGTGCFGLRQMLPRIS